MLIVPACSESDESKAGNCEDLQPLTDSGLKSLGWLELVLRHPACLAGWCQAAMCCCCCCCCPLQGGAAGAGAGVCNVLLVTFEGAALGDGSTGRPGLLDHGGCTVQLVLLCPKCCSSCCNIKPCCCDCWLSSQS